MKQFIKDKYSLFCTALMQVTLVAMNVLFIAKGQIIPMLVTGFLISLVWTLNVKRAAFGSWMDRIVYASGAMVGTGLGYWISHAITKFL